MSLKNDDNHKNIIRISNGEKTWILNETRNHVSRGRKRREIHCYS